MTIRLYIRNESSRKRLYRRDDLTRIAQRIAAGEGIAGEAELSVLFCDDAFIQDLNRTYRKKDCPTDVLAFCQGPSRVGRLTMLGDIVISLETVQRHCHEALPQANLLPQAMRCEVRLLFSHGLLHLLGYRHSTVQERKRMTEKQAHYLGIDPESCG